LIIFKSSNVQLVLFSNFLSGNCWKKLEIDELIYEKSKSWDIGQQESVSFKIGAVRSMKS